MPDYFESGFVLKHAAWHGLATILDNPPTAVEAIEAAGLDWPVTLEPMYRHYREEGGAAKIDGVEGLFEKIPKNFAVIRGTDQRVLGVVGNRFNPLQNSEAFGFFDFLVQNKDFNYESAGSLHNGEKVWVLASLADGVAEVVRGDPIHAYVLLSHAHNGNQSVEIFNTDIRVVCANTEATARASGNKMGGVRHTKNVVERVEALKDVVAQRHAVFAASMEQYKFLASKRMAMQKEGMKLFVRNLFGQEDSVEKQLKQEPLPRGGVEIVRLFTEGTGQAMAGVEGTHWAAFNAVTEFIDHSRGIGGKGDTLSKRVNSAWFGQGNAIKVKALEMLTNLSQVA